MDLHNIDLEQMRDLIKRKSEIEAAFKKLMLTHMQEHEEGKHNAGTCPVGNYSFVHDLFPFVNKTDVELAVTICLVHFAKKFFSDLGVAVPQSELYNLTREAELSFLSAIWLLKHLNEKPKEQGDA